MHLYAKKMSELDWSAWETYRIIANAPTRNEWWHHRQRLMMLLATSRGQNNGPSETLRGSLIMLTGCIAFL